MALRRTIGLMLVAIVASLIASASLIAGGVTAALAEGGLSVSSSYTYSIDPVANVVHVVADMTFTNTKPNRTEGNYINKTYFTGFSLPVPVEAVNTAGTQNGAPLTLQPEFIDGSTSFFLLNIDFARNLFYQQTAQVSVTYDIIGHEPRNESPTRVNAAYAAFNAFGIGDAGQVTVRVAVPGGYHVDTLGDDAVITDEAGVTVYTATDIDQPDEFNIFISARNDDALTTDTLTLGETKFVVRSWPGDEDWRAFVGRHITEGVPALELLVGQPFPVTGFVEVRRAVTPYLYGYAGWFDPSSRELEVGEELDPQTIVHELAHAWFNDDWFDDRWVNEGLAQEYSGLANEALGETPVEPETVDPAAAGALQLSNWGDPDFVDGADDTEAYGYNAAWSVIDSIVDEVGVDEMRRQVFDAVANDEFSYLGDSPDERDAHSLHDWRRLLDLVEQAGATSAQATFASLVLTPEQIDQVATRNEARVGYDELDAAGVAWAPPVGVRDAMSDWQFDIADRLITEATATLASRDDLASTLEPLGMQPDPAFETTYEHSTDGSADLTADIATQITAADRLVASYDELTAVLAGLGIEPTEALRELAIPGATDIGAAQASIDHLIDVAGQVVTARDVAAAERDFYERVGLYGDDVQADLDDAVDALAAGDIATAVSQADTVVEAIDGASSVGRSRVLRASLVAGGIVLAAITLMLVLVRRRRRRRRRAALDDPYIDESELEPLGTGDQERVADTL